MKLLHILTINILLINTMQFASAPSSSASPSTSFPKIVQNIVVDGKKMDYTCGLLNYYKRNWGRMEPRRLVDFQGVSEDIPCQEREYEAITELHKMQKIEEDQPGYTEPSHDQKKKLYTAIIQKELEQLK